MQLALFEDLGPRTDLDPKGLTCKNCGETKALSCFERHSGYANGYDNRCRSCHTNAVRVVRDLKAKHLADKPSLCQCCGLERVKGRYHSLVLDHCHDTNAFRGWICDKCNVGIGKLGDNLDGVLNAVAYLEKFEESK